MHSCISRESLKLSGYIHKLLDLVRALVHIPEILARLECYIYSHILLCRYCLCKGITHRIREIHGSSNVSYDVSCAHGLICYYLCHALLAIFPYTVVDNLLTSDITEIYINIRHGYSLRVQESLEEKVVLQRLNCRYVQTVSNHTANRRTSSRSNCDSLRFCKMNEIPHYQEIIHKSHALYDRQLIIYSLSDLVAVGSLGHLTGLLICKSVLFLHTLIYQMIQIFLRGISLRHIESRNLLLAKYDIHITPLCDLMCILQSLQSIWEQLSHLLL